MGSHKAAALTWELVTDVKDHKLFIAKLEHNSLFPSPIEKEKEAYEDLGSSHGIAGMVGLLNQDDYRVLILEFLGPDLHDLVDFCGGSFSLKTTLMLADQMICRLEHLHSKNIVHRDLKPDNFLMGRGRSGNIVYITDFGLASSYNWTEKHISVRDRSNFIGSERFASIRGHKLLCQTRKDDMESLGYTILSLLCGRLPWDNILCGDDVVERTGSLKELISIDDLCAGAPKEFTAYFTHVRSLDFLARPDYRYLRRLFQNLFVREGFEYDNVFDWTIRKFFMDQEAQKAGSST